MKKLLIVLFGFVFSQLAFSADFINPIGFVPNEENKKKVVQYIKESVKKDYSAIGMDSPSMLRLMENKEMESFKDLIKIETKNHKLLTKVKNDYCAIGMCSYSMILLMYKNELTASKKELAW